MGFALHAILLLTVCLFIGVTQRSIGVQFVAGVLLCVVAADWMLLLGWSLDVGGELCACLDVTAKHAKDAEDMLLPGSAWCCDVGDRLRGVFKHAKDADDVLLPPSTKSCDVDDRLQGVFKWGLVLTLL